MTIRLVDFGAYGKVDVSKLIIARSKIERVFVVGSPTLGAATPVLHKAHQSSGHFEVRGHKYCRRLFGGVDNNTHVEGGPTAVTAAMRNLSCPISATYRAFPTTASPLLKIVNAKLLQNAK